MRKGFKVSSHHRCSIRSTFHSKLGNELWVTLLSDLFIARAEKHTGLSRTWFRPKTHVRFTFRFSCVVFCPRKHGPSTPPSGAPAVLLSLTEPLGSEAALAEHSAQHQAWGWRVSAQRHPNRRKPPSQRCSLASLS